jgi:hypothetical protein
MYENRINEIQKLKKIDADIGKAEQWSVRWFLEGGGYGSVEPLGFETCWNAGAKTGRKTTAFEKRSDKSRELSNASARKRSRRSVRLGRGLVGAGGLTRTRFAAQHDRDTCVCWYPGPCNQILRSGELTKCSLKYFNLEKNSQNTEYFL